MSWDLETEQGLQRAGDNTTLQAFGPVALALMERAADLAESTDYGSPASASGFAR